MRGPLDGGSGLRCCMMLGLVIRDGSIQLDGRERVHGMGARDGEAATEGCGLGVGVQQHQRGDEMGTVAPSRGSDGSQQNLASLRGNDTDAAGTRLRLRVGMQVVMWARVRTHTHTHTHTHSHTHGVLGWLLLAG